MMQGKLPIFGPVAEDVALRGICIFKFGDKAEVVKLLNTGADNNTGAPTHEAYQWLNIPVSTVP